MTGFFGNNDRLVESGRGAPDARLQPPTDAGASPAGQPVPLMEHDRSRTGAPGPGSPTGDGPGSLRRKMSQAEAHAKLAELARHDRLPRFQVILPLDSGITRESPAWKTLDSLCRQAYPDWKLQLVDCSAGDAPLQTSQLPHLLLEAFGEVAEHVTLRRKASRETVGFGLGDGRSRSSTELVLILRPGDELGCDALLELALASAQEPDADFFYADDRRPSQVDERTEAFFKPDWSPELLLGWNYIGRSWCARRTLFRKARLNPRSLLDRNDHDLVLRLTEVAGKIVHVPKVLSELGYDWSKGAASEIETLERAMTRRGLQGEVLLGRWPGQYRVKRTLQNPARVSIIIPTRAAGGHIFTCIESLRRFTAYRNYEIICIENIPAERSEARGWLYKNTHAVIRSTDPFDCAHFNNQAVAKARGDYLLFLHDVVKVIDPDWLEALLEHAQDPQVGVVGAQLLYPDCSVQHAGLLLDDEGRRRTAFQLLAADAPGYFGLALSERNTIGLSGACQLMRREVFDRLGGYDESDAVGNYDLDFCLRAHEAGLRNVYTPHASLVHFEIESSVKVEEGRASKAFRERWHRLISSGDPYFNPNLARTDGCMSIERHPVEIVYPAGPLFARELIHHILVIPLEDISDAVAALPAVRKLKQHFPRARLSILAGCSTYSMWKMESAVDEIIEFDIADAAVEAAAGPAGRSDAGVLAEQLGDRRFDLAIDLNRSTRTRELLRRTNARWLAGYDDHGRFPWLDIGLQPAADGRSRNKDVHAGLEFVAMIDRIAEAASGLRAPAAPQDPPLRLPQGLQKALFAKPVVCIHPALGSPTRHWPPEAFAHLIARLLTDADVNIALVGSPADRAASERLLNRDDGLEGIKGRLFDLIGRIGPSELPMLLARCSLFVGRDCGFQHLVGTQASADPVFVPDLWMLRRGNLTSPVAEDRRTLRGPLPARAR